MLMSAMGGLLPLGLIQDVLAKVACEVKFVLKRADFLVDPGEIAVEFFLDIRIEADP